MAEDALVIRVRADTGGVEESLRGLEGKLDRLQAAGGQAVQPATAELAKAAGAADRAAAATGGFGSRLATLAAGGATLAGLRVVVGRVGEVAQGLLDAQIAAERLAIGLQFAAGGAASRDMRFVTELVRELGLELDGTATAYMRFAAAARGTRLEGAAAREVFTAIARATAVMGLSASDTQGVLLALQQMISKGTVSAEELRGQLGERLPGAFQIAARSMGVTTAELGKLLEQGRIVADEFLPRFARQLEQELGDAAARAGERTEAAVNRLSSAWTEFTRNTAQSGVGGALAGQLNILRDALDNINERMRRARDEGGGFWSQMGAAAVGIAQFLNPLNALSYSVQSSGERLKEARTELDELRAALERQPNNLMLRYALRDTERLVAELEKARAASAGLSGSSFTQGSADAQAARAAAAERDRAAIEAGKVVERLSSVNKEFAGSLQALHRAYELGVFTVEEYRRQVAALIDTQGGGRAMLAAAAEAERAVEQRRREAAREAAERQREAERLAAAEARAFAELNRERLAYAATLAKSVTTLDEEIRRQRESLEEIGLTGAALSRLRVKRLEARIAAEEAALATVELDAAERRAIELRIARLKELIGLERERAGREAAVDAARVAEQEWTRTSQVIEQSLTDALMRGFESGKDFGRNFRDALVNMFKTLVLRPIIQPIAQAGAGAILGALGLGTPGIANAATGGLGLGALGGLGLGGSYFATGLMNTLVGTGTMSGLSAAGSLIGGGNVLGGIGMGLGTIAPWAAAAYAAYSIIRGNRRSPAQQNYSLLSGTGASLAGGALDLYGSMTPNLASRDAYDEALRAAIAGISASALALGGRPNLDLRYGLYSSVSPDNRGGYTSGELRDAAGRVLYNVGTEGSNETVDQRLQQQISALFLAGLQASNLPQDIADYLGQFSPASTSQEQLNTIMATATAAHSMAGAVRGLGGALEDVAGLSVEARAQLAEFAGGFDNFAQQLRGFVEQYYSRDEIAGLRAREIRDVLAGVGITQDISTREQFRALVESLDVSGEQGRRQLAALLGVSGSFAGLADYLAESGGTLQSAAGGAPDLGTLGSALASSGQQQVQATIGVVERLVETNGLLARILERIGDTRIVIQAPSALEVGTIGGGN